MPRKCQDGGDFFLLSSLGCAHVISYTMILAMDKNAYEKGKTVLEQYLRDTKSRRSAERFALLEAVYSFDTQFTLEQLNQYLSERNFHVCRATLYNNIKFFQQLRLIVKHHLSDSVCYEICAHERGHCRQICTECGKTVEVSAPLVEQAFANSRLKRFRKETFTMYFYGICSTCLANKTKEGRVKEKLKLMNINKHKS